ncbi:helix-turn-helix transcriptional regulator [Kibdelosporangium aridum]|uniref:Helix-turn-helix domain-containing protein n=1 Tax=Kibdelosporangium aridum TaxID=2030 RepID=A0A1W2FSN4_KIBAR|nr:helix-turn-helix transcriptional regulator [Kibdelosporangium aridum]SMD24883.1 Helix-turn-helix domain-containing protein [Kibdelosporangium aridum]
MVDRPGLADFLRRRREMLRPADVGLPDGVRRRTPGLRRDEVAHLAGMSTDYYARLEQSRGANPSEPIVASLARVLRCDLDERDHIYHLAGLEPPARLASRHIRPGLISLLDRLTDVPASICTDLYDVLWQNAIADAILGPQDPRVDARDRNLVWQWFTNPATRARVPEEDWPRHSSDHVAYLRATHARRGRDKDVATFVRGLQEHSAEFRDLWEQHRVSVRRFDRKRLLHPDVGELHLTCEVLLTPADDLMVVTFFPTPGTDAHEKLDLLRVIGIQGFEPSGDL